MEEDGEASPAKAELADSKDPKVEQLSGWMAAHCRLNTDTAAKYAEALVAEGVDQPCDLGDLDDDDWPSSIKSLHLKKIKAATAKGDFDVPEGIMGELKEKNLKEKQLKKELKKKKRAEKAADEAAARKAETKEEVVPEAEVHGPVADRAGEAGECEARELSPLVSAPPKTNCFPHAPARTSLQNSVRWGTHCSLHLTTAGRQGEAAQRDRGPATQAGTQEEARRGRRPRGAASRGGDG